MRSYLRNHPAVIPALAIAAFFRILTIITYRPAWEGDSNGYTTNAVNLLTGQYISVDGARTPVYPLFLGLTQFLVGLKPHLALNSYAAESTALLQTILGTLSVAFVFDTLQRLGCRQRTSQICSILFGITAVIVAPERQILPQALETTFLTLSFWLFTLQISIAKQIPPPPSNRYI